MSRPREAHEERIRNELAHYGGLLASQPQGRVVEQIEPKVAAFEYGMRRYGPYLRARMPNIELTSYVVQIARRASRPLRLLSLGAGTGDWEFAVIRQAPHLMEATLVDLSDELLRGVQAAAAAEGVSLRTVVADVNAMPIESDHYDFIVCRSALHHFVELEHIMQQIRGGLAPDGQFLVIGEVIGRNGLQLYPETEDVAQHIFTALPDRLRYNHYTGRVDSAVPNYDHSQGSFEAIRSQDIVPLLWQTFTPVEYVMFDAFMSLLLDWRYGPNYDLTQEMDTALLSVIVDLDMHLVSNQILRPTALFGIFR